MSRKHAWALLSGLLASMCFADEGPSKDPLNWCPPAGPGLSKQLSTENVGSMKSGWVTARMRVRPGAVPVTDVRVISEAGGSGLPRTWVPLVRQWVGCAANERDTMFETKVTLGVLGNYQLPAKEGFSPNAFLQPRGAPVLPQGDMGVGVCPISATLQLRRPEAPNVVVELESKGGVPVSTWLEQIVPDREYMTPSPQSNRIEFACRVNNGAVSFYDN